MTCSLVWTPSKRAASTAWVAHSMSRISRTWGCRAAPLLPAQRSNTASLSALSGLAVRGYEIHQGQTMQHAGMAAGRVALPDGLGWQNAQGNVLGVYLHGLFEDAGVLQALFGAQARTLESVFDGLADVAERYFHAGVLPVLVAC